MLQAAPGATTGLRARPSTDGVAWDTWHLYPERGEVVRTRSSVVRADGTGRPAAVPVSPGERAAR